MNWLDYVVENKEAYSLRGSDITNAIGTKVIVYHNLVRVVRFEELLDDQDRFILLMESKRNSGHYVCVIYHRAANIVEFNDSYGSTHNELIQDLNYYTHTNGDYFLNNILRDFQRRTNCILEYNNVAFQTLDNHINTCGRWAYFRAKYSYLPLSVYNRGIIQFCRKHKLDYDMFITLATMMVH